MRVTPTIHHSQEEQWGSYNLHEFTQIIWLHRNSYRNIKIIIILYLVGGIPTPLKNMKVNSDDYSQHMETQICSNPPTSYWIAASIQTIETAENRKNKWNKLWKNRYLNPNIENHVFTESPFLLVDLEYWLSYAMQFDILWRYLNGNIIHEWTNSDRFLNCLSPKDIGFRISFDYHLVIQHSHGVMLTVAVGHQISKISRFPTKTRLPWTCSSNMGSGPSFGKESGVMWLWPVRVLWP